MNQAREARPRVRRHRVRQMLLRYRRLIVVGVHLTLIVLSNYLAFELRFESSVPDEKWWLWLAMLPWIVMIRGVTFIPFRLYQGLWRYASIWDLRNIIAGVVSSTILSYVVIHWGLDHADYPRVIFVLDSIILIMALGGIRLGRRIYRELGHLEHGKRVLIFGAGDAGEMLVRDIRNNPYYDYEPIGFIDDDTSKVGKTIHGVRVFGTRDALPAVMASEQPDEVIVAIPRATPATIRGVVAALQQFKVPIRTLPSLRDVLNGSVTVSQVRNLSIEDLLTRKPVRLESSSLEALLSGQRVLVTGAGGSIGSELCRQIAACRPAMIALFERYENALYEVGMDLAERGFSSEIRSIMGDVTDIARVAAVLEETRPHLIFHAAAHKHVPLMESNPCEAVKNNVTGTRVIAEAAARAGVSKFVLISTDKAVNPASIMGATKRIAEMVVQWLAHGSETQYVVVRFGNVLGSNGSVVPRFLQQIKAGGPVTVTHPEMQRYFMLIPEAVQLVLHAAAVGGNGSAYVLNMGDQMRVVDIACNLIRLSGYTPHEEIPIEFIGMRPGEKLMEELIDVDEVIEPCPVPEVYRVRSKTQPDLALLVKRLTELEQLAAVGDRVGVLDLIHQLVPRYPLGSATSESDPAGHGG